MILFLYYSAKAYNFPSAYPPIDQTVTINGQYLTDPVILAAINKVNSAVKNKTLLSIRPSTYDPLNPSTPRYNDDADETCYWPFNSCTNSSVPNIKPDISTCPGQNTWGITFDDGPTQNLVNGMNVDDSTALQTLLDSRKVKVTYFIVGSNAIQYPNVVKAHFAAGHQIALHTWSHHPLTSLTNEQIVAEIIYNEAIVVNATGAIPTMMRPPYGDIDDRVRAIVQALGYQVVLWSRDSGDADQMDTSQASRQVVLNNITSWFKQGPSFIGLEHDISTFSTNIAITALQQFFAMNPAPLNPMPVATCLNLPFYSNLATNTTQNKPTNTTQTTPTNTTQTPTTNNNQTLPISTTATTATATSTVKTRSTQQINNSLRSVELLSALWLILLQ